MNIDYSISGDLHSVASNELRSGAGMSAFANCAFRDSGGVVILADDWSPALDFIVVSLKAAGVSEIDIFLRANPKSVDSDLRIAVHPGIKRVFDLHREMSKIARPGMFIDICSADAVFSRRVFKNALFYIQSGGCYWLPDSRGTVDEESGADYVLKITSSPVDGLGTEDLAVRAVVREVSIANGYMKICKDSEHRKIVDPANSVNELNADYGRGSGCLVFKGEGVRFSSAIAVTSNMRGFSPALEYDIPPQSVWCLQDVDCSWGQVVGTGRLLLADSFRRPSQRPLRHTRVRFAGPSFVERSFSTPDEYLEQPTYLMDSEYPGHFGHFLTEVLGRIPGYLRAREQEADLRLLVSVPKGRHTLPRFMWDAFEVFGVRRDSVDLIYPGRTLRVRELWSATPSFSHPFWVAPELVDVWDTITSHLGVGEYPAVDRVFASRRYSSKRSCENWREVEELFLNHGYSVIYPEDYRFAEQVALFANAREIAGFAGSNMFQLEFARRAERCVLVTSESYTAINELMIAAVRGIDLHYSFHRSKVKQPRSGWSKAAFFSNFTFNMSDDSFLMDLMK